jgi:hypothetical protein
VVRRLTGPASKGFHRVTWDLREPAAVLVAPPAAEADEDLFRNPEGGPYVTAGKYRVKLFLRHEGTVAEVDGAEQEFAVTLHGATAATQKERAALAAFQKKVNALNRAVRGTLSAANALQTRLGEIKRAVDQTPKLSAKDRQRVVALEQQLRVILRDLRGDVALRARNENTPQSISEKVSAIVGEQYNSLSPPTKTHVRLYDEANALLAKELIKLREIKDKEVPAIEKALDEAGAPYTPGRLPALR